MLLTSLLVQLAFVVVPHATAALSADTAIEQLGMEKFTFDTLLNLGTRSIAEIALLTDSEIMEAFTKNAPNTGGSYYRYIVGVLAQANLRPGRSPFAEFPQPARIALYRLGVRTAEDFYAHREELLSAVRVPLTALTAWALRQKVTSTSLAQRSLGHALNEAIFTNERVLDLLKGSDAAAVIDSDQVRALLTTLRIVAADVNACITWLGRGSPEGVGGSDRKID